MSALNIQHEAEDAFQQYEESFRKNYPMTWWLSLVGPFLVTLILLALVAAFHGVQEAGTLVLAAMAAFFVFGRFVILFGNDSTAAGQELESSEELVRALGSEELFCMLTYMDVMVAVFVAFHAGILFRLPFLGAKIAGMVADAQFILRMQPWMQRATFLGLVAFVIFPTSTTGSIGGSFFGRLLGMNRGTTLLAIFTGSVLGNGVMYFFSEQLRPLKNMLHDSLYAKIIGALVVLAVIFAIERWFRAMKKKYMTKSDAGN